MPKVYEGQNSSSSKSKETFLRDVLVECNLEPPFWQSPFWILSLRNIYSVFCQERGGTWFQALCFGFKGECYCQIEIYMSHINNQMNFVAKFCLQKMACATDCMGFGMEAVKFHSNPDLSSKPKPNHLCLSPFWKTDIKVK